MGWRFTNDGMRLILSRGVPRFVATGVRPVLERFLGDQGVTVAEVTHHVLHPGGAKVMATYRSAFGFDDHAIENARETMRRYGNQSSASVLFMLHDLIASGRPEPGDGVDDGVGTRLRGGDADAVVVNAAGLSPEGDV